MAVTEQPLAGLGYSPPVGERAFVRLEEDSTRDASAAVAEEVPIAFVYNGRPHVVVMGTPADLEDLAAGFSWSEGIVAAPEAVQRVSVVRASHGIELQIEIPSPDADRLELRARGLAARTGCGLCGVERVEDAMRVPPVVSRRLSVAPAALWRAGAELSSRQRMNAATSTVHGAAWAGRDGGVRVAREDVGRHNALDKVLGAVARAGERPGDGFVVVTSRASYEMVQKAAACGVELIAAVSRPTGLAIRFADAAGVTLVGLLRGRTANVYSGAARVVPPAASPSPIPVF